MNAETEHLFEHYGDILRARGLAPRSITIYQYSLKGFVGFLGGRWLSAATSADITSYQIQLGSERASDSRIHVARPTRCARCSVSSWNATTGTMCGSHCPVSRRGCLFFACTSRNTGRLALVPRSVCGRAVSRTFGNREYPHRTTTSLFKHPIPQIHRLSPTQAFRSRRASGEPTSLWLGLRKPCCVSWLRALASSHHITLYEL
jgi:hypothetical protein